MPARENGSRRSNSDAAAAGPRPRSNKPDIDPTRSTSRHGLQQPHNNTDSSTDDLPKRHVQLVLPEMQRRSSESRSPSVPYPSFSKQHSREAVRSLDNVQSSNPFTPQATDLSDSKAPKTTRTPPPVPSQSGADAQFRRAQPPPSPPSTTVDQPDLRRAGSGNSMRQAATDAKEHHARRKSADNDTLSSLRQAEEGSGGLKAASARPSASSKSSLRSLFQGRSGMASGKKSPLTKTPLKKTRSPMDSDSPPGKERRRGRAPRLDSNDGYSTSGTDSPRQSRESLAPTSKSTPRPAYDRKAPALSLETHDTQAGISIPPPPPPPPLAASAEAPRVDYLLQYGGLGTAIPKDFVSAFTSVKPQQYQQYMSPKPSSTRHVDLSSTFDPFCHLLDEYSSVLSRHGSMAVATGYKSVARRLLDRLENVFSRNISSETCECVLCRSDRTDTTTADDDTGVSWGEVLELVSGRQDLPPWPPFALPTVGLPGLGIRSFDQQVPMQKLDIDVPEEYREHYIRQSKKTKQAVDKWLAGQPEDPPPPPQEIDDETMIFAMLTYLEADQRRGFTALLRGLSAVPDSRAPTPAQGPGPKSDLLSRTGMALQRLYRLARPPRDPECAMFLLKNRGLHSALATLSAISQHEWDILISGRFDGFLWSGAEENDAPTREASRAAGDATDGASHMGARRPQINGHSYGVPLRTATPGGIAKLTSAGPVQLDEETEIAVLSEIEREIYLGMEALEDAFETLHSKAEGVRNALLQRSAGLALQAQRRKGTGEQEGPQARMGTPAAGLDQLRGRGQAVGAPNGASFGSDDDDDGGMLDGRSELAPDDSASNVGWREREKRNQRYKKRSSRRTERRTPAPVEEEDEEEPPPTRARR